MPWDFGALNTLGSLRSFQTSLGGAGLATKLHSIRLSPSFLCFYLRYRITLLRIVFCSRTCCPCRAQNCSCLGAVDAEGWQYPQILTPPPCQWTLTHNRLCTAGEISVFTEKVKQILKESIFPHQFCCSFNIGTAGTLRE